MKKLFLLLMTTLIFSCSSDDSEDQESRLTQQNIEASIVNRWYVVKTYYENSTEEKEVLADECEQNGYIQFNSDKTSVESYFVDHPSDGCLNDMYIHSTYTYNEEKESIVITDEYGDVFNYRIENITDTEIALSFEDKIFYYSK